MDTPGDTVELVEMENIPKPQEESQISQIITKDTESETKQEKFSPNEPTPKERSNQTSENSSKTRTRRSLSIGIFPESRNSLDGLGILDFGPSRPSITKPELRKKSVVPKITNIFKSTSDDLGDDLPSIFSNSNKKRKQTEVEAAKSHTRIFIAKTNAPPRDEVPSLIESRNFVATGKTTINGSIILLLLLIMRFCPELVSGEKIPLLFHASLRDYTGWEDVSKYIGLSYWIGACSAYIFCLFVGVMTVYVILPAIHLSKDKLNSDEQQHRIFRFLFQNISNPFYILIIVITLMSISHIFFVIGLYYRIAPVVITFRGIFGFLDGSHIYLHTYFLVKQYKRENFCLALGFLFSISCFTQLTEKYVHTDPFTYLWVSCGLFIVSIFSSISLPYLDMGNQSIFRDGFHQPAASEATTATSNPDQERSLWGTIGWFGLFVMVHQILNICVDLGITMFPFHLGGTLWNVRSNSNPLDATPLQNFRASVLFAMAILSPGVGALLDTELIDIPTPPLTFWLKVHNFYEKSKKRIFAFLFGLTLSVLFSTFSYYAYIPENHGWFYVFAILYGFSLSLAFVCLMTLPMIYIMKIKDSYRSMTYAAYQNISSFIFSASKLVNYHVITTEEILQPIWFICVIVATLFLLFAFTLIMIHYFFFKKKGDAKIKFEMNDKVDAKKLMMKRIANADKKWSQYCKLIYIFPFEICVFLFGLVVFIIGSGILNIVLVYTIGNKDFNLVFILPVLSMLCLLSMKLAFPEVLNKFFGSIFFAQTRRILKWYRKPTIGASLSSNPNFSMATAMLETKYADWEAIHTPDLKKELVVFVIPDEIVLADESERVEIREKVDELNLKNLDVKKCCNGFLIVDEMKNVDRNMFLYQKSAESYYTYILKKYSGKYFDFRFFTNQFLFFVFSGYAILFAIPLIYKAFQKVACGGCSSVKFFDESISILVQSINFTFGFFILIPFIGLFQEISKILERLVDMIFIFKANTISMLTFKTDDDYEKLNIEMINRWDKQFQHLQALTTAKGAFVRYIFMVSYSFAKFFSLLFSLVALFVKVNINAQIIQLSVLVFIIEIGLMRYILQPASCTTTEFKLTVIQAMLKEKMYNKNLESVKRAPDVEERMRTVSRYLRSVLFHWDSQATLNEVGFSIKSFSIQTRWYINSELMRSSIMSFALSVIPSVLTYFVKQIFGV